MPIRAKRSEKEPDSYLNGIRNADLDEDYWRSLDAEQRQAVRDSGLWSVKTDKDMAGGSDAAPAPHAG